MKRVLFLFDIDGTLSESRKIIQDEMRNMLLSIKDKEGEIRNSSNYKLDIGVVGGSDLEKQQEQLDDCWKLFDYQFPENGLVYYRNGEFVRSESFANWLGREKMKELVNIPFQIYR